MSKKKEKPTWQQLLDDGKCVYCETKNVRGNDYMCPECRRELNELVKRKEGK